MVANTSKAGLMAMIAMSFVATPLVAQTTDRPSSNGVLGTAITQILGGRNDQPVAYGQSYQERDDVQSRKHGRRYEDRRYEQRYQQRYADGNRGRDRQDDRRYRDQAMQQCTTAVLQRAGNSARLDTIRDAGRVGNGYRFEGRLTSSGRYPVAYQGRPQDRRDYGQADRTQDFSCSVRNGRIVGLNIR